MLFTSFLIFAHFFYVFSLISPVYFALLSFFHLGIFLLFTLLILKVGFAEIFPSAHFMSSSKTNVKWNRRKEMKLNEKQKMPIAHCPLHIGIWTKNARNQIKKNGYSSCLYVLLSVPNGIIFVWNKTAISECKMCVVLYECVLRVWHQLHLCCLMFLCFQKHIFVYFASFVCFCEVFFIYTFYTCGCLISFGLICHNFHFSIWYF